MADAAVTVALETIRDLLVEEGKFLLGVRDQAEELRVELLALQSFLKDAIARKHEHESVRNWVSQAKRLAYEAEDIIEEYAIKVPSKRGGGFRKVARRAAGILGEGTATHKVGNEIENVQKKITNLKNNLKTYGIEGVIEAQPSPETIEKQRRLRTTYPHEVDEYFVGMEDDVSKIITWVTEDDMIHRVISISGTGGLGKTTIARKVFNHIKKSSFKCFAWVSVTPQCQVKMLLQDILKQILGEEVRDLEETELVTKLYDVLKNKKCFVVLDDIWKPKDWESLRQAFPTLEGSSKILLTTRITEVAEVGDSWHKPKLLEEEDGWDLLTKIALKRQKFQGNTLPETVKNIGTSMLRKCGGLPLAISALGGILRNKDPLTDWETINKKFGTYLRRDDGVVSVLAFSYDDLPSYLRPCFLYMGCFREDEEIDITRLYHLWMAEGLISTAQKGPEETLMDVASGFLYELISRNMVQPIVKLDELKDNKSCRLHDLMRELCLTKGKEEEFMEVKSIEIHGEKGGSVSIDDVNLCRQTIFIDNDDGCEINISKSTGETCFRALIFNQNNICIVEGAMKFKSLRSLILDNCRFKNDKLPKEIKDMIHLRYLSLQNSLGNEGKLPAFIGDLQYIQILDLSYNTSLRLPNIFYKMKRLRCLYLPKNEWRLKSGNKSEFHGLKELEVVEILSSTYVRLTRLSKSVNLRRLKAEIWGNENLSTILEQLSYLLLKATPRSGSHNQISVDLKVYGTEESEDVKNLLLCCCVRNLKLYSPIGEFPRYEHHFWPNLVDLILEKTKLEEDPMPFLQELPNLRDLRMFFDAYVGKEMYCSSKAFPKLTQLIIWGLHKIEKWRVDAGAFPNLQSLYIGHCRSFEEIVPDGLTSITTLTWIDMDVMPEEFRNKYGSLPNSTTTCNVM